MSIPLYLLTYNCGKLRLNAADFAEKVGSTLPSDICDLYVFGFQELCSIMDGAFPDLVNRHLIDIDRIVLDTLKTKYLSQSGTYNFTTVGFHHVGAIGMIAVTPFALKFRDCRYADASCGNCNSLLKGAVGFRMKYAHDCRHFIELTFACAHLSAYEGDYYYQRRVANIQTLMRGLDFGDGYSFLRPHSHAFFMGDLNFRTTKSFDKDRPNVALTDLVELQDETKAEDIEALVIKHDELTQGKNNGELFTGFDEACITFRPTYKYHLDTAIYNTKRCPLWCDRIFFQNTYRGRIQIHSYKSICSYMRSDHRPVYLHVTVPLDPPDSIISANGYLMVLPSARPNVHGLHVLPSMEEFPETRDAVSGPTQIYMKCTAVDKMQQLILRRISDFFIGYSLWFTTTPRGRLLLLLLVLLFWILYSLNR